VDPITIAITAKMSTRALNFLKIFIPSHLLVNLESSTCPTKTVGVLPKNDPVLFQTL
jgi:hypothetical protein